MNELTTKTFENELLKKATEEIIKLQKNVNESLISVAGISGEVAKSKSYEDDGFKSAQEWLMNTFNYKKSTAYTMVKIGKEYTQLEIDGCLPIYKTIFADNETDRDFSLTQLEKLLPLGKEKISEMLKDGSISYDMTVKEIKEFVSDIKSITDVEKEVESEATEATEATEVKNSEESKECVVTIEIWNNCIFVNDEKYNFNDLNEVVKYMRKTIKNLNK